MDIITGYTGTPHITAENDRDINIGIFGSKSYVLQTGTMLTAEISNNNEIKVRDGVIMHQGCAASIKKNTYDSVTINNGSQGMKRIDLIVARYEKQPETNVESLTLKVLQGTPAETSPQVPAHTEGDIQAGDTVADMPLYEVEIDGLNITEIRKVFQTMEDLESVNGKIDPPSDSDIFLTGYAGGLWTGGGKNLCFSLPVAYNLSNIKKVIPTKITLTSRQAGSYCYGGADDHEEVDLKTDIVKIDPIKDMSQLNFSITFPTVRAKTNNDATGVSYSIILKLQDF